MSKEVVTSYEFKCDGPECRNFITLVLDHLVADWYTVTHDIEEKHYCSANCLIKGLHTDDITSMRKAGTL